MQNLSVLKCSLNDFVVRSSCRSSSTNPSIISRVRYVLNHYWLGSKLLYQNYKSVQQIKKKDKNCLTRLDKLALNQFAYDIRVGIPFVGLFAIPIIGYSAPLIALVAPKYLPSTLIMPKQKMKFLQDDAQASSNIIPSFMQLNEKEYDSEKIVGIIPIIQFINEVSNSNDRYKLILSSIDKYSSLFNRCFSLSKLSRSHLLILHQSVLHSSFIADYFLSNYSLEYQLELWEYKTLMDDKQLINIEKLSPYLIVSSLYSRGLYLHLDQMGRVFQNHQNQILNEMDKKSAQSNEQFEIDENILNDWKQLLNQWIQIHQKLNKTNQTSTSFLLHISPLLYK